MTYFKKTIRACGIGFFIATIMLSGVTIEPKKTDAAFDIVFDPDNWVKNTLSAANTLATSLSTNSLNIKETVLDPLAFSIAKKMLQQITYSIIDWINSGFDGSPAFITDYKQFFLNAMDRVAGEFLQHDLGFLCQPFQFDIKVVLSLELMKQRDFNQRSTCTLTGSVANVENFVSGNFAEGGWKRWFEITTDPRNNFFGALEMSRDELQNVQDDEKDAARTQALAGQGMASFKICVTDSSGRQHCPIATPGFAIADQLNRALGAGQDTLITADEINEVISALFNQLAVQAITGVNGLLGLSYSGANGEPSYMSQFYDDIQNNTTGAASISFITDTLRIEQQFLDAHEEVMLHAIDVGDLADSTTCSASNNIQTQLTEIISDMAVEIDKAETNIQALNELKEIFLTASADIQIQIAQEFQNMTASGQMPSQADLALRQNELDEITETLEGYEDTLDSCN